MELKDRPGNGQNQEYWQHHIREWRKSELNLTQYCEAHGVRYHALRYWLYKLKDVPSPEQKPVPQGRFRLMSLQPREIPRVTVSSTTPIRVQFPECVVMVEAGTDRDHLSMVVDVLRSR
jgi:hypothetical protein